MKIYGYARISTSHQNIQRQIRNIKAIYSDAVIIEEGYSGMKLELRRRTAEGIETAKINGKQIGRTKGDKLVTKKSIKAKEDILNI